MTQTRTTRQFTGRHMLTVMVVGFGVVIAVNFTMASLAIGGFHGVLVDNTYVASQKFNGWIEEAQADKALGWEATGTRDADGFVVVTTQGVPVDATIMAKLRRPLGEHEFADLTFAPQADGTYRSLVAVGPGRWTMRLTITAAGEDWASESEIR